MTRTAEPHDPHAAMRRREMQKEEREAIERADAERKNRNFAQVYPDGWKKIRALADKSAACVKLYALLCEHIDGHVGAVCASQTMLAEELGVSERTIRRLTKDLEDAGALLRIRVGNGVFAYAINPHEVWKSWDNRKSHAAFVTKTIVSSADARAGHVRLKAFLSNGKFMDQKHDEDSGYDPETGEILD